MCGIFGYFCLEPVDISKVLELLQILEHCQYKDQDEKEPVGGHGAGVCFLDDSSTLVVYKVGMTSSSPARALSLIESSPGTRSRIVLGHVRRASSNLIDTIHRAEAAQPYKTNCLGFSEVVSAHNGKVENFQEIRKTLPSGHCFQSEVVRLTDSEVIPHLFEENLATYRDEVEAAKRTLEFLEGNNAVVLLSATGENRLLHILHKGHSRGIHVWKNGRGGIILCSRQEPLRRVFGDFLDEGDFKKVISIEWKEEKVTQKAFEIVDFDNSTTRVDSSAQF